MLSESTARADVSAVRARRHRSAERARARRVPRDEQRRRQAALVALVLDAWGVADDAAVLYRRRTGDDREIPMTLSGVRRVLRSTTGDPDPTPTDVVFVAGALIGISMAGAHAAAAWSPLDPRHDFARWAALDAAMDDWAAAARRPRTGGAA